MDKFELKIGKLLTALLLFFSVPQLILAQSSVMEGNIIKEIKLQEQAGQTFLVLSGEFNLADMKKIAPKIARNSNKFILSIPNTLIDPETIKSPFIQFKPEEPLESIQIVEKINELNTDAVSFVVDLVVESKKRFRPKLGRLTTNVVFIGLVEEKMVVAPMVQKAVPTALPKPTVSQAQQTARVEIADDKVAQESFKMAQAEMDEIIKHYRKPSLLQISILNASGFAKRAYKLSVYLGKIKRKTVEEALGAKLDIVNIANSRSNQYPQSTIYFRDNFLKSALYIAQIIPGEQKIMPLKNQKERIGVDIEIFLGKDYK